MAVLSLFCPDKNQTLPYFVNPCEEGCQCNTWYLFDGQAGVSAGHCGFFKDGGKFKVINLSLLNLIAVLFWVPLS